MSTRLRSHPVLAAAAVVMVAWVWWAWATRTPSTDRDYVPEQSRLPAVSVEGDEVDVRDVRSFVWHDSASFDARWVDRRYDASAIRKVWLGLSPFAAWRGPAHVFLSFQLGDSQFVAVSVEARREKGEDYSPLAAAFRQYELMIVFAEEPDLIGLRTHVWKDPVELYPVRATPQQARALFLDLARRAESLRTHPEYYNTLTDNCATNLAAAVNDVHPGRVGATVALLLPGYADRWAEKTGLLDVTGPVDSLRSAYRINQRAEAAWGRPDFSEAIRRP